jgi:hypothetical protein
MPDAPPQKARWDLDIAGHDGLGCVDESGRGRGPRAAELPNLPLEDLLQLVHLYAERGSPKYEKAALRWLERYLVEQEPRLQHFAEVTVRLAQRLD